MSDLHHDQSDSQTVRLKRYWLLFGDTPSILERNPCTLCRVFLVASKGLSRVHLLGLKKKNPEVQSRNEQLMEQSSGIWTPL